MVKLISGYKVVLTYTDLNQVTWKAKTDWNITIENFANPIILPPLFVFPAETRVFINKIFRKTNYMR